MTGVTQERIAGVAGTSPIRETRETAFSTTAELSDSANYAETPHWRIREESREGKEGGKKGVSLAERIGEEAGKVDEGGKTEKPERCPAGSGDDAGGEWREEGRVPRGRNSGEE